MHFGLPCVFQTVSQFLAVFYDLLHLLLENAADVSHKEIGHQQPESVLNDPHFDSLDGLLTP